MQFEMLGQNTSSAAYQQTLINSNVMCYICDEPYSPSMIILHLEECKEDWMYDEYKKPEHERIPLPTATQEYMHALDMLKMYYEEQEKEKERELPRSISPIEQTRVSKPTLDNFKMVEGGLAECPHCHRTFFPDRLMVHLKSCKSGKPLMPKKKKVNMRWQSPKKKEVHKNRFRMPLPGKDMMITGKIIEKAEEEEEDSDEQKSMDEEYEDDFDFEQYKDITEECLESKKTHPAPHSISSLRDKGVRRRERCEFCNLLIPFNKLERHKEECNQPQSKKLVLNVKSIKFSERVQKKKSMKSSNEQYDSFDVNPSALEQSIASNPSNNSRSKPRDFKIRSQNKKKRSELKNVRRETRVGKSFKRPSTKEAVNRDNSISRISDGIESASCQFSTAYPIKTPVQNSTKHSEVNSNQVYGLSKTNESFKKGIWSSGCKAQNSTIGFSSSTNNTTGYSKDFGEMAFRNSKYLPNADQTTITRSSFYIDRELSETLMMRSQTYLKIQCPHCTRQFCRKAGERHIPLCDKIFSKPKPLFRNKQRQFLPSLTKGTSHQPENSYIEKDPRTHSVKPKSKILTEDQIMPKRRTLNGSGKHSHNSSYSNLTKAPIIESRKCAKEAVATTMSVNESIANHSNLLPATQ